MLVRKADHPPGGGIIHVKHQIHVAPINTCNSATVNTCYRGQRQYVYYMLLHALKHVLMVGLITRVHRRYVHLMLYVCYSIPGLRGE